jgi:hypothetical protein
MGNLLAVLGPHAELQPPKVHFCKIIEFLCKKMKKTGKKVKINRFFCLKK